MEIIMYHDELPSSEALDLHLFWREYVYNFFLSLHSQPVSEYCLFFFNPLYSDGFSHIGTYRAKARIFWIMVYIYPWRFVVILANSVDPDEMQHNAAFHLGLHCL